MSAADSDDVDNNFDKSIISSMDHQKTTSIKIKAYLRKVHCANCKVISRPSVSVADSDDDDNVNNNTIIQKWMHEISPQSKQTPSSTKSKCAQS